MVTTWPLVPLAEVLAERQESLPANGLVEGAIQVVAKIGFNDGLIQLRSDGDTKTKMIVIRPGDLVISGINAAKGAIGIYEKDSTEPIAATIHYSAYQPNTEKVNVKFLWWLLRSTYFRNSLQEYLPGGIKTELRARRLLTIPIPLPELPEQVGLLTRIDQIAERVAEAKMLRTASARMTANLLETCIQDVMSKYPRLHNFAEVITFKPRSGPSFPTSRDWHGTPVIMPSAVTGFGVDIDRVEFGLGREPINNKDLLQPGDILIARGNKRDQVGNAGVVPPEIKGWVYANLLMRLQVNTEKADPHFCVYWLRSPMMRNHVKRSMTGTNPSIQKINQATILRFPFPTSVALDEQRQIVDYLDGMQRRVNELKRVQVEIASELDALLPSLLDRAFKGEL